MTLRYESPALTSFETPTIKVEGTLVQLNTVDAIQDTRSKNFSPNLNQITTPAGSSVEVPVTPPAPPTVKPPVALTQKASESS